MKKLNGMAAFGLWTLAMLVFLAVPQVNVLAEGEEKAAEKAVEAAAEKVEKAAEKAAEAAAEEVEVEEAAEEAVEEKAAEAAAEEIEEAVEEKAEAVEVEEAVEAAEDAEKSTEVHPRDGDAATEGTGQDQRFRGEGQAYRRFPEEIVPSAHCGSGQNVVDGREKHFGRPA